LRAQAGDPLEPCAHLLLLPGDHPLPVLEALVAVLQLPGALLVGGRALLEGGLALVQIHASVGEVAFQRLAGLDELFLGGEREALACLLEQPLAFPRRRRRRPPPEPSAHDEDGRPRGKRASENGRNEAEPVGHSDLSPACDAQSCVALIVVGGRLSVIGRRYTDHRRLRTEHLSFPRRQQLRQIVGQRRQPCRDFPFALARLEQLVGDVQGRQDRRLVGLHDRTLAEHLLQRLIHETRHLARVLRRQVRAHRVLLAADHHLDGVLLRAHRPPPPPLPDASRACSSRNVSRPSKLCTRERAASTLRRSCLFSTSSSASRPRVSGSTRATPLPRPDNSRSSDSVLRARVRQAASSSAMLWTTASNCSSACTSALSPPNVKLFL